MTEPRETDPGDGEATDAGALGPPRPARFELRRLAGRVSFALTRAAVAPWHAGRRSAIDALPPATEAGAPVKSVLVVNLLKIGDHVTALPALAAMRASIPRDARIEMLCAAGPKRGRHVGAVELYRMTDLVDEVHLLAIAADARALRGRHDRIIVFGWRGRDAIAGRRARGRQGPSGLVVPVAGHDHGGRGFALDVRVPPLPQAFRSVAELAELDEVHHQTAVWLDLVVRAGLATPAAASAAAAVGPLLDPGAAARADARALLAESGIAASRDGAFARPVVVLHGWNGQAHYRWPAARWAELGARLVHERGAACAITAPPDPDALAFASEVEDGIRARVGASALEGRLASLAGILDLRTLAAVTAEASLIVAVDTGVTHLAAAAGARVVALFGPGSPRVWGPWGAGHVVLQETGVCHGCRLPECVRPTLECLDALEVQRVLDAIPDEPG